MLLLAKLCSNEGLQSSTRVSIRQLSILYRNTELACTTDALTQTCCATHKPADYNKAVPPSLNTQALIWRHRNDVFQSDIPATGNCMHGWLKFTCYRKPSGFHWWSSIEFQQRLQLHVLLGMVWHLPYIPRRTGASNSCCQLPLTTISSACCGQDAAALHSSPSPINGGNSPTLCLHNHITSLSKSMHGHDKQIWQARHVVQPMMAKRLVLYERQITLNTLMSVHWMRVSQGVTQTGSQLITQCQRFAACVTFVSSPTKKD